MSYPLALALRYMASKKQSFISIGTVFAMLGVTLGVAALTIVMSVTGGFQEQFREKVLGVNAHVLVLKYSVDFREYRDVMKKAAAVKGVVGIAPFVINPMMVTHGDRTATGVLLKGVDPELMPKVLDLPKHIVEGTIEGLRRPGAAPPDRSLDLHGFDDAPSFRAGDTGAVADAGANEGGTLSLLQAIERQIAEDEARARLKGASVHGPDGEGDGPGIDDTDTPPALPAGAPVGDVTPKGGFASALPDEDVLPESVDPDPCRSPEQVKKLPGVILGKSLSRQLGLSLGDCVQVTSPTIGISFGASARPPVAKQFRVIAVFEAGFDQYDSKLVYTDLFEAQAFYEYGDSVTGVEMKVDDIEHARAISKEMEKILANSVYHTLDWQELNHGLFTALFIQKILMTVVLGLMIVVAAFTVIATLIMIVLDKKKEIAILKALGAKNDALLLVFLYQGGIIGVVGAILGVVLGYAGCRGLVAYAFPLDPKVYFISKLPVNIRLSEFSGAAFFAVAVCVCATIAPALYAARLRPSDGLRGQ